MAEEPLPSARHSKRRASLPTIAFHPSANHATGRSSRGHGCNSRAKSAAALGHTGVHLSTSSSLSMSSSTSSTTRRNARSMTGRQQAKSIVSPERSPPSTARRGRRHSIDVPVTSESKSDMSKEVESLRKAWSEFCRVSEKKSFRADDYEKECPHGSMLFKSALSELMEEDPECGLRTPSSLETLPSMSNDHVTSDESPRRRRGQRQVRFKSDSDSDS